MTVMDIRSDTFQDTLDLETVKNHASKVSHPNAIKHRAAAGSHQAFSVSAERTHHGGGAESISVDASRRRDREGGVMQGAVYMYGAYGIDNFFKSSLKMEPQTP